MKEDKQGEKPRVWKFIGIHWNDDSGIPIFDGPPIVDADKFDVIEKSAYDALAKENEELKKEKEINWDKWNYTELETEITSLRESLKVAVEALALYEKSIGGYDQIITDDGDTIEKSWATETLAKITAKHGEL